MIKFLHTADLHLGRIFHDQSLREDQAAMLKDLAAILEDESYAALVIAGDVYDRSVPSPEAVDLFGSFLGDLKKRRPSLEIIAIPGNHDSAARLGFGRELFGRLGIRFGVAADECDRPVVVTSGGESCAFFLLPFLNSGSLERRDPQSGDPEPLRSQAALAEEAAGRMEKARRECGGRGVSYSVLAAHLFVSGGSEAGSERIFLGTAEQVNAALFKGFDYVALGHLHRCQRSGENAWYSGSPLAYSFGEAPPEDSGARANGAPPGPKKPEKFFLSVELSSAGAKVEKIPVKPLHKLASLSGPFVRFSGDISSDPELLGAVDDYLEIRLTDLSVTENARDLLRKRFPRLLSLRQDEALAGLSAARAAKGASPDGGREERRDVSADFREFLASLYGETGRPDAPAELELFNSLLAEVEAEENDL